MPESKDHLYLEYTQGGYIYLPKYMEIFREVESRTVSFLVTLGAQEVMLPKLLTEKNVELLESCDYRFKKEWNNEQLFVTTKNGENAGILAHWQCEPIYQFVPQIFSNVVGNDEIKIIFDNSGYSYRLEEVNDIYRPNEFRRVEVFFHGDIDKVRIAIDNILEFFERNLKKYNALRVLRPEESFGGKEEVEDVVTYVDGREIEVVGSHIHFDTFATIVPKKLDKKIVTACCGIALSRITSLIAIMED